MHEGGRMMWMWFHTKLNDTLLFKSWWIHDPGKMVWSCLIVAVLAVVLEALRWYSHMLNSAQYLDMLLYFAQSVLAYTLMLSFMTFSVWICLSLCIGLTIGHYLFGVKRFKLTS
ncbi:Ctr copper transporter family protein [Necator americanus]|uniref:Copper transport protein n=1 Tax=Necator americanus TaxID=51031 RepID=W2SSR8_NECAM|nr:Ctr copper transporter family protein [Necator americanus]ETN71886.1 Ctr copper transporter family protein [Necator americanus]